MGDLTFINGLVGGFTGVVLTYPFDSIKTHYQLNNKDLYHTVKDVYQKRRFYRGALSPFIGIVAEKGVVFWVQDVVSKWCIKNNIFSNRGYTDMFSGLISGISCSFIVTPYEQLKIAVNQGNTYNQIYQQHYCKSNISTTFKYLYKGLMPTIFREGVGFSVYFMVYNYLKHNFAKTPDSLSLIKTACFGGVSGATAWLVIYPFDMIKTLMQDNKTSRINISTGIKGFYRGLIPTLIKVVPFHACVFMGFEASKKFTNQLN